jgi:hypothetical protein
MITMPLQMTSYSFIPISLSTAIRARPALEQELR